MTKGTIAVTGGSGSVGLAVLDAVARAGWGALDLSIEPPPAWAYAAFPPGADVRHLSCDVRDAAALTDALADAKPVGIVHLAAITADEPAERADPVRIVDTNVGGTAALLQAVAAARPTAPVLVASSVNAYGAAPLDATAVSEDAPPYPATSLYGVTKLCAEQVARRLADLHGLDLRIARLSAVWGPFERRTGQRPVPSVPFQIAHAVLAGTPVRLPTMPSQALIEAREAAETLLALLFAPDPAHRLVNVANGLAETYDALLADLVAREGVRWSVDADDPTIRVFTARRPPLDVSRLARTIGRTPRRTLADAFPDYLAWARALPDPTAPFTARLRATRGIPPASSP